MDALYSATLLAALTSAMIGAVSGALALWRPEAPWRRMASWSINLALLFGAVSFTVHLHFGHGPASPEPMDMVRFLRIHPAYGVVLLLSLFGIGAALCSRRRR